MFYDISLKNIVGIYNLCGLFRRRWEKSLSELVRTYFLLLTAVYDLFRKFDVPCRYIARHSRMSTRSL